MIRAKAHVLLIEDDEILGGAMVQRLKLEGFDGTWVKTCREAAAALRAGRFDFILSDIVLPDGSGEDVFRAAQPWLGDTPILFATAFGEVDQAVRLVKAGADDYITKPYDADDLVERIRRRTSPGKGSRAARSGRPTRAPAPPPAVAEPLRLAAASDLPILLTGETGVGKEVAARHAHAASPRAAAPFVAVNCGAIPHDLRESQFFGHERGAFTGATQSHVGYFEEAGDGTLFLDEVGELDVRLQTALLRVLHDGEFRPLGSRRPRTFRGRIVAATNADLARLRMEGKFREDLYYRLAVIEIAIPPLRQRPGEIAGLAKGFLDEFGSARGAHLSFSPAALERLIMHDWPGNIRELRNRVQRAIVFARTEVLEPADVFPERRLDEDTVRPEEPRSLEAAKQQAEMGAIERALAASGGRIGDAARSLGISRTTLWKRRGKRS